MADKTSLKETIDYRLFINDEQINQLQNLRKDKRWNEFINYDFNIEIWYNFWTTIYKGNKEDVIMDFGCGSLYSKLVGNKCGFTAITGLDIDNEEVRDSFGRYHDVLNVKPDYWNGSQMNYVDDFFDSILAKASLSKCVDSSWDNVINELVRVSKPEAKWYISPKYMIDRLPEQFKSILDSKQIKIIGWDWDRSDSRNKSIN